jgi:hypothetical protein
VSVGTRQTRRSPLGAVPVLTVGYLLLSAVGLAGTWYFNLRFGAEGGGQTYLQGWFANAASSSAAVDVIVTAVVACVFYVVEGRRLGMRRAWVLVPLTFLLALAFTFPLFLALRERALARREPQGGASDAGTA